VKCCKVCLGNYPATFFSRSGRGRRRAVCKRCQQNRRDGEKAGRRLAAAGLPLYARLDYMTLWEWMWGKGHNRLVEPAAAPPPERPG
jgi:hypothetical protein